MSRSTSQILRLDKPPFVVSRASPDEVGRIMADTYTEIAAHQVPMTDVVKAAAKALHIDEKSPLAGAALAIARRMDDGEGVGIKGGYHCANGHFKEVPLNATQLILLNNADSAQSRLGPEARGEILTSAVGHDWHYQRGGNKTETGKDAPYRLETISFFATRQCLEEAGVSDRSIQNIGVMIYGTDVSPASRAGSFIRAAHRHHFDGGQKPQITPVLARVAAVLDDPLLARQAAILAEADILSGAGLTVAHGRVQDRKLGRELAMKMGPEGKLWFLDNIVEGGFITSARFFQPNMDEIRREAALRKAMEEGVVVQNRQAPPPAPSRGLGARV